MDIPLYVPVMPVLQGDMEGARHASADAQGCTWPFFVIVEPRSRAADRPAHYLGQAADLIAETWSLRGPAFVELYDVPSVDDGGWWASGHPLGLLYEYLQRRSVKAIPVIATDRSGDYLNAFTSAVKNLQNGMAVRLYEDDLELPEDTIQWTLARASDARCQLSQVHLVIDLERISPSRLHYLRARILDFLAALDHHPKYGSVTLVGSSIPPNLQGIPTNQEREVARMEVRLWRDARAARGPSYLLGLGDYLTVRPDYDDRQTNFKHINAKIFYTLDDGIRVLRGQSRMHEKLESQYAKLSRRLTANEYFKGADFSWGDARMHECASWPYAPGSPTTWISYMTSHHFELVAAQATRELVSHVR